MKLNFCTLFNSGYLSRGLVLYESLLECCPDFHLYVFAFDDICFDYLSKKNLKNLTVISLKEFEDEELLRIKPTRTIGEYCWTCTASTIRYAILKYNLEQCTYIDADMYFYTNPKVLIDEMGDNSVLITEHRYTKEYDQTLISGKYCVQFMTFFNNEKGMKVLERWRNDCINWCYARVEDGKFGDQKYLDTWTKEFEGVHELKHLGGAVAPWNMQQYDFRNENNKLVLFEKVSNKKVDLVFFHFHALKLFADNIVCYTSETYKMDNSARELIFKPYTKKIILMGNKLMNELPNVNFHAISGNSPIKPMGAWDKIRYFLYRVKSDYKNLFEKRLYRMSKYYHFNYLDLK